MTANEFLHHCLGDFKSLRDRSMGLAETLSPEQLQWRPDPKRWSAGQICDHLIVSGQPYEVKIAPYITGPLAKPGTEFAMSFMGKLIARAAGPNSNAPVPPVFMPRSGPTPPDIAHQLVAHLDRMIALTEAAMGKDLGAKVSSPASRLVKLSVGDVFRVTAEHNLRHIGQIEDLVMTPGFPAK